MLALLLHVTTEAQKSAVEARHLMNDASLTPKAHSLSVSHSQAAF
jgi:hypothetical protein